MGTVVAIETEGGVVVAGDSLAVDDGVVESDRANRVFEFDGALVAAVGDQGSVDEFARQIEREVKQYSVERDGEISIDRLGTVAADIAADVDVTAVVAAPDSDGAVRLREVGPDGRSLPTEAAAIGSGAGVALGRIEGADVESDLDRAVEVARESVDAARERDTETGSDVTVKTLESSET